MAVDGKFGIGLVLSGKTSFMHVFQPNAQAIALDDTPSHSDNMKPKIDSDLGKRISAQRFATVEPVFGNLRGNKRLPRFTLRGKAKVEGQWKLFCLVHNLEKLAHHGYAA
jgi:hypothetical protein